MKDVLEVLKEMGAKNIDFDEAPDGEYRSQLSFDFNGKVVRIWGEWFNTQEAGIGGDVETI